MLSRNVDLNLLVPLRALLEERSVSRAAERMHMSQPALSAALSRLRRHFNDPILRRSGNSYELTPLGVQLLERSYAATVGLERLFSAQAEFDPATSTREFTIASSDYCASVLGGSLATVIGEIAPSVRVRFIGMNSTIVDNAPESLRDIDGLLIPHGYLVNVPHLNLFRDRWVCIVSKDNTIVGESLTLEMLSDLHWVYTFSGRNEYTPAAKQMELLGVEPHVDMVTSSFLVVPSVLEGSNRIALVHELSARRMARYGDVRVLECPFDVVPFTEAFWWNAVHDRDPEHIWIRSMLSLAVERAGLPTTEQLSM